VAPPELQLGSPLQGSAAVGVCRGTVAAAWALATATGHTASSAAVADPHMIRSMDDFIVAPDPSVLLSPSPQKSVMLFM
jgi:hypothetical protein